MAILPQSIPTTCIRLTGPAGPPITQRSYAAALAKKRFATARWFS